MQPIYLFRQILSRHTPGPTRWQARRKNLLWEFEWAYQFGRYGSQLQSAGMTVTGIGYEYAQAKSKPRVWLYYDWPSVSQAL